MDLHADEISTKVKILDTFERVKSNSDRVENDQVSSIDAYNYYGMREAC